MAGIILENVTVHLGADDTLSRFFNRSADELPPEDEDGSSARTERGAIVALDRVDLAVEDGETVVVVGPSGCGKTTLLRVVGGLAPVQSGALYFGDVNVTELSPRDRGVGIVFQNYALYPHMEGKRNLGFFFKMHKREQEVDERVEATCAIMGPGFEKLLGRKPKSLSGGEKQRVAIARCIIRDPRAFLFDEPLSNLDAKLRSQTRVEIKRLLRRFGITALYVTHDQTEAMALGDRIAVMQAGRIVQIGSYREIYERPLSKFVAGFFGSPPMNLFAATVQHGCTVVEGHEFDLHAGSLGILDGERVTLGIRPEDVTVDRDPTPGALPLVVDIIQNLVSERKRLISFPFGGGHLIAKVDQGLPIEKGDAAWVRLPAEKLRVFDTRDIRVV